LVPLPLEECDAHLVPYKLGVRQLAVHPGVAPGDEQARALGLEQIVVHAGRRGELDAERRARTDCRCGARYGRGPRALGPR
jgi:hypothetical protein